MLNRVLVAIAIAATGKCAELYMENRQLRQMNANNLKRFDAVKKMALYALDELDRNEVPYDEFDAIVFDTFRREAEESA